MRRRCDWCGVEYTVGGNYSNDEFCSRSCKQRAGRHRKLGYPSKKGMREKAERIRRDREEYCKQHGISWDKSWDTYTGE